jgi:hypothetical protein
MLNKFTPEEAAESIAESRETLRRIDARLAERWPIDEDISPNESGTGKWDASVPCEPRVETTNERHRREITEQERHFGIERERERVRQERAVREHANTTAVAANQRIAELEDEVLELARGCNAVVDALEHELARDTSENTELKLSQARLETRLAELSLKVAETVAADRSKAIDLPPLLPRTTVQ